MFDDTEGAKGAENELLSSVTGQWAFAARRLFANVNGDLGFPWKWFSGANGEPRTRLRGIGEVLHFRVPVDLFRSRQAE